MAYAVVFAVALALNLVWEFLHVRLYTTKVTNLYLAWQSVKDAVWITIAYVLAPNVYTFGASLLIFSYLVELHAISAKRWEYAPAMPLVFGVGLTPLLELAVTGLLTLWSVTLLG